MYDKKEILDNNDIDQPSIESIKRDNVEVSNAKNSTLDLYRDIISTIFNILSNPIARSTIKNNENILKLLVLQVSNLFYLETKLKIELADKKLAREFLQIISDITNISLTAHKSINKTEMEILEDRNLLIVTTINSCKNVDRASLELTKPITVDDINNLNNQITALSDFSFNEDSQSKQINENHNNQNINININQNNNQNSSVQDLNNNLANLSKAGILPQHPATNVNFYPYLTKPSVIPKIKKVLSGLLLLSASLTFMTIIISFFVRGTIPIEQGKDPVSFVLSQTNNWILVIMTMVLYSSFAYMFLKPVKMPREKYHTSYFLLGLLLFWLVVTIFYFFWGVTDKYFETILQQMITTKDGKLDPNAVTSLENLPNFELFKIMTIITASSTILPVVVLFIMILINPRLDRNKIMRANIEYQNAITAALNGQKYEIDASLFDKELPNSEVHEKETD